MDFILVLLSGTFMTTIFGEIFMLILNFLKKILTTGFSNWKISLGVLAFFIVFKFFFDRYRRKERLRRIDEHYAMKYDKF